jgi:hypothetical protein
VLRPQAEERLKGSLGRASSVEPERELVQVDLQVLMTNAVVRPPQPGLEIAKHAMHARQQLGCPPGILAAGAGAMPIAQAR